MLSSLCLSMNDQALSVPPQGSWEVELDVVAELDVGGDGGGDAVGKGLPGRDVVAEPTAEMSSFSISACSRVFRSFSVCSL